MVCTQAYSWFILDNLQLYARTSAEKFSGGPIIEPVLTTKVENFLKFWKFKKECVKIQEEPWSSLSPLPTAMALPLPFFLED